MDKIPLNFALLANPWNWIVVLLMVFLIGQGLSLIFHRNVLPVATGA